MMAVKIPVLHYEEVTDTKQLNGVVFGSDRYVITDEKAGKQYIVEVWA